MALTVGMYVQMCTSHRHIQLTNKIDNEKSKLIMTNFNYRPFLDINVCNMPVVM